MKVLIGTDSRGNLPRATAPVDGVDKNWVDIVFRDYRQNIDDITYYRHSDHVYVFTLPQLKKHVLDQINDYFDLAIIQTGWHELVCPWPKEMQRSFYPDTFDEQYIIETHSDGKCRYFNPEELRYCVDRIKDISKHQLFIGMHSLLNVPSHRVGALINQEHIHQSNDFFASLGIDYLHMPNHSSWALKYNTPDKVHYMDKSGYFVANYINRYINRMSQNIISKLVNSQFNSNITVDGTTKSYNEFLELCKQAGYLISQNTNKKDVVLIAKETSFDQLAFFIGAILYDRIPLLVQPNTTKVSVKALIAKLNHVKKEVCPTLCICDKNDYIYFTEYFHTICPIINDIDIDYIEPNVSENDIAFMQLSSGTTNLPKIISVTHKQLISHCDEYSSFIKLDNQDYITSWLPVYHDMGLIACFLMPLLHGISFSHIHPFKWLSNPQLLYDDIIEHQTTLVWMPNFAFKRMSTLISTKNNIDMKSIRHIISCSEQSIYSNIEEFIHRFHRFGLKNNAIQICYALAENVFAVSQSSVLEIDENRNYSCGEILPGTSVMIWNNKDVTDNEVGEIYIRSSYQPLFKNDNSIFGYYPTGDIGYTQDEKLFILGRKNDKIISYGVNYMPYEFESAISAIEGVIPGRVSCFGLYNNSIGTEEIIIAVEGDVGAFQIWKKVSEAIGGITHKCIVLPKDFLVKTSSGKLSRTATKAKLLEHGYISNT